MHRPCSTCPCATTGYCDCPPSSFQSCSAILKVTTPTHWSLLFLKPHHSICKSSRAWWQLYATIHPRRYESNGSGAIDATHSGSSCPNSESAQQHITTIEGIAHSVPAVESSLTSLYCNHLLVTAAPCHHPPCGLCRTVKHNALVPNVFDYPVSS